MRRLTPCREAIHQRRIKRLRESTVNAGLAMIFTVESGDDPFFEVETSARLGQNTCAMS